MAQPYDWPQLRAAAGVLSAEQDVADAQIAVSKGGSIDAYNRANSRLANAHCAYREISDGRPPDRR